MIETTEQNQTEVKPREITEADVIGFLAAKHAELKLPAWASVQAAFGSYSAPFGVYGHTPGVEYKWVNGSGNTVTAALAEFTDNLPPTGAELAKQKRAEAAKLLAEAEKAEAGV